MMNDDGAGRRRAVPCGAASRLEEVSIRRRPPSGKDVHGCGRNLQFEVPSEEPPQGWEAVDDKPRNILEEIVWFKNDEIAQQRERMDLVALKRKIGVVPPARDFVQALKDKYAQQGKPALIAEAKKASPSKGIIKEDFDPVDIALEYEAGGAACISVLTDSKYFKGGFENLELIRQAGVSCPLLCKEFIIEAYQIFLARASGADAILLIAAVLPNADLAYLIKCAKSLGMASLVEVVSLPAQPFINAPLYPLPAPRSPLPLPAFGFLLSLLLKKASDASCLRASAVPCSCDALSFVAAAHT